MILGVLLLAANVGLFYWIQAKRSTARIRELEAELKQRDDGTTLPIGDSYRPAFKEYLNGSCL